MEHILVSTDLSEESLVALPVARREQQLRGGRVTLLHVIEVSALAVMPVELASPWVDIEPVTAQMEARAKERLEEFRQRYFPGEHCTVEVVRAQGATYEEILAVAEREKSALIVMGRHGRSGLERMFLGSVTNKVVQLAKCPVLVVPVGEI